MKKISLILCVAILLNNVLFGQKKEFATLSKQDSVNLYNRVEKVEKFQNVIEKDLNLQVKTIDQKLNTDYNFLKYIVIYGGSFTLLGLLIGIFVVYKKSVSFANKKSEEIIEKFFNEKKEQFIKLVKDSEIESTLKRTKKILLLSINSTESKQLFDFCSKLDFANIINTEIADFDNINENKYLQEADVIVINNIHKSISDDDLLKILNAFPKCKNSFLYYGIQNNKLFGFKNINFANSEFTLYARIMETLKTQNILANY
ncbi:MAG: hypothetical protein PHN56_06205 [Candidatus Nanoarchaeia archaeon]|nr:hypothetical protein [Candidatus Nanoarchaeia archaeon]